MDCFSKFSVEVFADTMCLNSLKKANDVELHQFRRLVFENIEKFSYSKLVLIENIVKGERD